LAAARHGDLDECQALTELWPVLEQELDRPQAFDDPLRVVETVDAKEDASVAELCAQPAQGALGRVRAGLLRERADVDRDRVRSRPHPSARQRDRSSLDADVVAEARTRAHEIVAIRFRMERDDVGAEQTVEHLLAP